MLVSLVSVPVDPSAPTISFSKPKKQRVQQVSKADQRQKSRAGKAAKEQHKQAKKTGNKNSKTTEGDDEEYSGKPKTRQTFLFSATLMLGEQGREGFDRKKKRRKWGSGKHESTMLGAFWGNAWGSCD